MPSGNELGGCGFEDEYEHEEEDEYEHEHEHEEEDEDEVGRDFQARRR